MSLVGTQYIRIEAYVHGELHEFTQGHLVRLTAVKYTVAKETPRGVRLDCGKLVLHDSTKKFAHQTMDAAMESFIARKRRQIGILRHQLKVAEAGLKAALSGEKAMDVSIQLEPMETFA